MSWKKSIRHASGKCKEDEDYRKEASGGNASAADMANRGYMRYLEAYHAVFPLADLKKNYANLNVEFDLWKGESDAQPYIPDMVQKMKDKGLCI